jgi:bla regulator protein blaR1
MPDGLTATGLTVKFLIGFAYDVKDFQISGGPGWIDSEHYDIEAKIDDATAEALKKLPLDQMLEQRRIMLRSLLADRFKLKVTESSKELPIYALVVAKNGPKLTKSTAGSSPEGPRRMMRFGLGELSGTATMGLLAEQISRQVDREVVDKTGLQGDYDFTLHFAPERPMPMPGGPGDSGPGGAAPPPDSSAPSLFTALQEQLGLKLEPQKGPVKMLIIDSVERPSEN